MAALKAELRAHPGVAAVRSYKCRWAGSEAGGLEGFVEQVVTDTWELLRGRGLQGEGAEPPLQEAFLAAQQGAFRARSRLLAATATAIRRGDAARLLVTGEPGCGRTVFMAALAKALEEAPPPGRPGGRPLPRCRVAYHFAGARPDQSDARVALAHLGARLASFWPRPPANAPPEGAPYRELRDWLHRLLAPPPGGGRLVLLLDDGEELQEGGAPRRDWLPAELPPRVTVVLSAPDAPGRLGPLPQRLGPRWGGASRLALGPLPPPDCALLVREELRARGRSLDPAQLRIVLGKGGARLPLYLKLLLADLRAFASHEDLDAFLGAEPASLPGLLGQILRRLEERHGPALPLALAALGAAPHGLREGQLLAVLGAGRRLGGAWAPWAETLEAAAPPGPSEEPGAFWELLGDLRWLLDACGSSLAPPGARLQLAGAPLREASAKLRPLAPGPAPRAGPAPREGWEELTGRARRLLAAVALHEADPGGGRQLPGGRRREPGPAAPPPGGGGAVGAPLGPAAGRGVPAGPRDPRRRGAAAARPAAAARGPAPWGRPRRGAGGAGGGGGGRRGAGGAGRGAGGPRRGAGAGGRQRPPPLPAPAPRGRAPAPRRAPPAALPHGAAGHRAAPRHPGVGGAEGAEPGPEPLPPVGGAGDRRGRSLLGASAQCPGGAGGAGQLRGALGRGRAGRGTGGTGRGGGGPGAAARLGGGAGVVSPRPRGPGHRPQPPPRGGRQRRPGRAAAGVVAGGRGPAGGRVPGHAPLLPGAAAGGRGLGRRGVGPAAARHQPRPIRGESDTGHAPLGVGHAPLGSAPLALAGGRGSPVSALCWPGPALLAGGGAGGALWLWALPLGRGPILAMAAGGGALALSTGESHQGALRGAGGQLGGSYGGYGADMGRIWGR
ncbi:telomerase protein component 1 [Opisthocomus hoazin]|uniref:telomerase protein component 1 n=1 Tax=Opisthocomus hoazin TaxID=30419 RepID=UPI003F52D9D8